MAQHSPTPLRRWISGSVRSEDEQPLEGVPARVIRLLADNRVHPSGSPRGGGAAQRLSRHGMGQIMPLRGGVSSRSRSKSISKSMQPTASGHNRALKAATSPSPYRAPQVVALQSSESPCLLGLAQLALRVAPRSGGRVA
jgi:hypothetical protein